jgi:hypothetical protein
LDKTVKACAIIGVIALLIITSVVVYNFREEQSARNNLKIQLQSEEYDKCISSYVGKGELDNWTMLRCEEVAYG